ncbi:LEAF RUST 10 DISEASE-RESISTANCE LOCUS RECEPTOR-LIKE PROTEIN KINASE-like 1.1 [Gossypium arboreum]|uniref:Protein kinase domain-containing protein n=1 Tax=Gossypium arboreum TaxID=29729 RepID=A0ABR0QI03_GOSAR|nr:LEAF RUST 10 DISEASE-RESISTANCE LOCUS RECEPTOR-LIKE PROTEIN KINASE-like 1.1 [Gossypium arboreum]KAK5838537.1 hypothetical protein PVK06_007267 [Gossypium arboreum]
MADVMPLLILLLLSQFLILHSAEPCPVSFQCGNLLGDLKFPYTEESRPACGLFVVKDCNGTNPSVQLDRVGQWYRIHKISQADTLTIYDESLVQQLRNRDCSRLSMKNFLPHLPYVTFGPIALCTCKTALNASFLEQVQLNHTACNNYTIYYPPPETCKTHRLSRLCPCSTVRLPLTNTPPKNGTHSFILLTPYVSIKVNVSKPCKECHWGGGTCLGRNRRFYCTNDISNWNGDTCLGRNRRLYCTKGTNTLGLKLGLGIGGSVTVMILIFCIFVVRRRPASSNFLRGKSPSHLSSTSDLENNATVCFGLPIFSYTELVEATNNFDDDKVLGDGGFGTVYFGKLRDGREVAIKRLYQHNYRRHEQFMNEVKILTRLRHKNLVSLYGCTSRRSRELILVYEFVPNGTVADHLHGDHAQSGLPAWPVRMSIAIETATALAYLHASDIIHRDVKTNNILLDENFSVKVADFGLSRLFPNDVTHISTAPQGTPGYVDPEYHQCYQLTEKSDVYSFGVVLIELISSMPAVDINRHRHEINLANLAISKIQKCAFDELIDPNLGYKSCEQVARMTTLVAELAFRCLQQEKELRPSMEEVLEELQRIKSEAYESENVQQEEHSDSEVPMSVGQPPSPPIGDQIVLLKNIQLPPSPVSVADKWISQRTTPNSSE